MTLGQKIKELRVHSGLKQRELASALGIGEGFLSKVESDQKSLKREDLLKLNRLFKIPIQDLETLWLAHKVCVVIRNEKSALIVLKVAEEQLKHKVQNNDFYKSKTR